MRRNSLTRRNTLTLKLFFLIVLTDLGDSVGQLFMKKGLLVTGINTVDFSNVMSFLAQNACSPLVWFGIFLFSIPFFIWIVVLSKVDLSIAMPVGSVSYIIIPIVAMIFLKENVSLLRWGGIFMIIVGIYFVSKSKQPVPEAPPS